MLQFNLSITEITGEISGVGRESDWVGETAKRCMYAWWNKKKHTYIVCFLCSKCWKEQECIADKHLWTTERAAWSSPQQGWVWITFSNILLFIFTVWYLKISSLEGQCADHKKCIEQLKEQIRDKALQCDQLSKEKGAILTRQCHVHAHIALYQSLYTSFCA